MLTAAPGTMQTLTGAALVKDEIAVVVPVYMGKAVLRKLCARLVAALETITPDFSIILVDDRAPDDPWPLIRELGREDRRIRGVQLSRNFGQHYALTAGIDHARAEWYVVMDCDLQDAPEDIPLLYAKVREVGFDAIVGVRAKKGHGFAKRHASRLFYRAFNLLAGFELDWSVGNFRIFSDRVAEGFRQMREQMRLFPASLSFMGFSVGTMELPHHPREDGKSSYTFAKLARLAADAILAHSQTPLKVAATFGLMMALLSILAGVAIAVRALVWGIPVTGWASLIVAVFVVGGVQIFITGIVGIYVGKTFEEAKKRPLYFVRDTVNLEPDGKPR
jgi:glycosyltransferase involved in cell wall biosynthesis